MKHHPSASIVLLPIKLLCPVRLWRYDDNDDDDDDDDAGDKDDDDNYDDGGDGDGDGFDKSMWRW